MAASVLLGFVVGDGGTWLDRALTPTWVCAGRTAGTVCEALATERGLPFPVYASAVAPLLAAGCCCAAPTEPAPASPPGLGLVTAPCRPAAAT